LLVALGIERRGLVELVEARTEGLLVEKVDGFVPQGQAMLAPLGK
jgi:hypothetical protein